MVVELFEVLILRSVERRKLSVPELELRFISSKHTCALDGFKYKTLGSITYIISPPVVLHDHGDRLSRQDKFRLNRLESRCICTVRIFERLNVGFVAPVQPSQFCFSIKSRGPVTNPRIPITKGHFSFSLLSVRNSPFLGRFDHGQRHVQSPTQDISTSFGGSRQTSLLWLAPSIIDAKVKECCAKQTNCSYNNQDNSHA